MNFKKHLLFTSFLLVSAGIITTIATTTMPSITSKVSFESNKPNLFFSPENIYDQIILAINTEMDKDGIKVPSKDDQTTLNQLKSQLSIIISDTILKNENIVANDWLPNNGENNPIITPSDIVIDETKIFISKNSKGQDVVTFDKGAINMKEIDGSLTEFPALGNLVCSITPKQETEDNSWVIWVVVGTIVGIAIIFIVLLICYIVKRKKSSQYIR